MLRESPQVLDAGHLVPMRDLVPYELLGALHACLRVLHATHSSVRIWHLLGGPRLCIEQSDLANPAFFHVAANQFMSRASRKQQALGATPSYHQYRWEEQHGWSKLST